MSVYADWKEVSRDNQIDSTDSETIGGYLGNLPDLQQYLLGFELSRPDKVVVNHLKVEYATMKWENDENCQVNDPDSMYQIYLKHVEYDSYWTETPSQINHGTLSQNLIISPCSIMPIPFPLPDPIPGPIPGPTNMVKTKITFNNHTKTL